MEPNNEEVETQSDSQTLLIQDNKENTVIFTFQKQLNLGVKNNVVIKMFIDSKVDLELSLGGIPTILPKSRKEIDLDFEIFPVIHSVKDYETKKPIIFEIKFLPDSVIDENVVSSQMIFGGITIIFLIFLIYFIFFYK